MLQNLLSPPVLFFVLGITAVLLRSDLEIPAPLPKLFSLYLLLAIGFKGGVELQHSGLNQQVLLTIAAAVLMSLLVPLSSYWILRRRLDVYNAAAVAASYGSISAVTFITAESFLETSHLRFDGFMVAALALMESPAIIVGLLLVRTLAPRHGASHEKTMGGWGAVLHEAFLNSSVLLLLGSLLIGLLSAAFSPSGIAKMEPFSGGLFYGALSFFLLDMGIVAAQRLQDLRRAGAFLVGFALLAPVAHALVGLGISRLLGLPQGDALARLGADLQAVAAELSHLGGVPAVVVIGAPDDPAGQLALTCGAEPWVAALPPAALPRLVRHWVADQRARQGTN